MNLQPDPNTPGLWVNPAWKQGEAGTFATIIGISHYTYLDGGPQSYSLGQLYVSALTAHRFFLWLRDLYSYANCPLAMCWLLLSPTDAEIATENGLSQNPLQPTYQNCSKAIRSWFDAMWRLPKIAAQQSRSFFFFSGHGVEMDPDKQILLPSDYLEPPAPELNRALSTTNLHVGLSTLQVPHQFFFVDACRSDLTELRTAIDLEGDKVLPELRTSVLNPDCVAPLICASGSGTQAFQPTTPTDGISLFGQALLEGLHAPQGLVLDCSNFNPCAIKVNALLDFIRPRVTQLLAQHNATVQQHIPLAGSPSQDLPVTQLPIIHRDEGPPRLRLPVSDTLVKLTKTLDNPFGWQPNVHADSHAREVFGDELMTTIWLTARIYSLSQHTWLTESDTKAYACHSVELGANKQVYRFVLSIPGPPDNHYWLELNDGSYTFACILPGDEEEIPRYVLDMNFEQEEKDEHGQVVRKRGISALEVSLARDNPPPLNRVAELWEKYSRLSVSEALEGLDAQLVEVLLAGKGRSPLAATIAGIMLLRAHRVDLTHDWLYNLANWFKDRPDGPVLLVEYLTQKSGTGVLPSEAIDWLLKVPQRGLPQTTETFGYADRQVKGVLALSALDPNQQSQLLGFQQRLNEARRFFRPGGLFTVFSATNDGTLIPQLVEGNQPA